MKEHLTRHIIIERLLVLANTSRQKERFELQLIFTDTEELVEIYERQKPKCEARGVPYQRVLRRQERFSRMIEEIERQESLCAEWSKRWQHPSNQYPMFVSDPNIPTRLKLNGREVIPMPVETLELSLDELYETASVLWLQKGNADAFATCRVIGTNHRNGHEPTRETVAEFNRLVESNQMVA